jgi:succinate dehydrogenase / fumarate reductase cytochrome b subunit
VQVPTQARPLSPHLSIYRWTATMTMSILHRATGIALYAGMILLALWFIAAAAGPGPLEVVHVIFASWIGQIILFLFTWALFHHLLGGIRHFIYDSINGFSHPGRFGLAWANIIGSVILTLLAWAIVVWF